MCGWLLLLGLMLGVGSLLSRVERGSPYPPALEAQLQVLADALALALRSGGLHGSAESKSRGARAQRKAHLGTGLASFIRGDGRAEA